MACSCAARNNASVQIFKSLLDNHCQVLSLSTFSGIFLTNCPCIYFSLQFFLSSCAFYFLNSPLVSINCLGCSNSQDEDFFRIGNIKTQIIFLFSAATINTHQTSASLVPVMYNHLSTSLLWCNAPYIVIIFLDFLSRISKFTIFPQ